MTFLDECTFSGDKKQSAILKGIISEEHRSFNQKYAPKVTIQNYSNYIVASNFDHIVFVKKDDRRFLMIKVDDKYSGPKTPDRQAYFDKIVKTDPIHVAHFLYHRDITRFNPEDIPNTTYGRYQKILNFDSAIAWYNKLLLGEITYLNEPFKLRNSEYTAEKSTIYNCYRAQPTVSFRHSMDDAQFFACIYDAMSGTAKDFTHRPNGKNIEVALFGKEQSSRPLREVADRVITVDGRYMRGCWKS